MTHPDLDYSGQRLPLVGSRVVESEVSGLRVVPGHRGHGHDGGQQENAPGDSPEFLKTEAATNFELFYDLWFVANLNVFTSIHDISNFERFTSFIGYMVLLWTTWLLTTLYDVRFTADSVWERCCKAVHLGVMIGFAEIGTNFEPDNQIVSVFRTMALFLAVSRFVLFLQYGVVFLQIRKYAHGKWPMFLTATLHLCTAAVYFGVSFRYNLGKSSRVFLVWYIGGVVEMAMHLSISQLSHVLTFVHTHLGERLNLLTLVILGEGCIILAKSVTLLVKDTYVKDHTTTLWSPSLIGLVTSATALIYIIFQLYFDWMHDEHSMSKRHQVWWAALHLPFNIALVLLLEGASQFIVWARIAESTRAAIAKVVEVQYTLPERFTSQQISDALAGVVEPFLKKYQPYDVLETWNDVHEIFDNIADIPNSFWEQNLPSDDPLAVQWRDDLSELVNTMVNAVYNAFDIKPEGSKDKGPKSEYWQSEATMEIARRFILVYIYSFACAGIVMLFMTIMHVISKRKGWSPFNIFRTAVCISIALILSLLTVIAANRDAVINKTKEYTAFVGSVWMLPVITIFYFVALVLTHVPHPSGFCTGAYKRGAYKEVAAHREKPVSAAVPLRIPLGEYEGARGHNMVSPPPAPPQYEEHRVRPISGNPSGGNRHYPANRHREARREQRR
ncbi:hypothetical protein GGS23DRAFT_257914 [Durotheca rogersii]|uniref:uncharacterized protein n=1 Tax=Durotheca rogersii TaxID=419775 RepID=UPI002220F3A2|nr:uncharacterized protein GGS23DRAFT_257914 [Durotheca rogersii]KAI5860002.1 hypothetical protein GGS23DRAFT_257914 [Durotheca rogersii]